MKIIIIRHGKVNMQWRKWSTSKQFDMDCIKYDDSPLYPISDRMELDDETDEIYISTLRRSRETAEEIFNRKDFIETELLNEVPLKSFCDSKVSLPLLVWNIAGRLQWLLQNKRQTETKSSTKKRADDLIEIILQKNKDCVLVSHGFYMKTLIRELKRYGYVINRNKVSFANLEKVIAIK